MLAALLGSLALALASGQDADASCVGIADTARLAAESDPRVRGARAGVQASEADFSDALALRRPQASAFARSSVGATGLTSSQIENQVGFQVSQRLLDFGDARFAREGARNRVRASEFEVQVQQIVSAADAAQAHLNFVLSRRDQAILAEQVEYLARLEVRLERLLAQSASTRDAVAAVRSRLASARAELSALELSEIEALTDVAVLTGDDLNLCAETGEDALLSLALLDESDPTRSATRSPRVEALQSQVASAQAEAVRVRRQRLPAVDVVAIGSYAYDDFRDEWAYRDRVGVDVTVPIYQGDMLRARVSRAQAEVSRRQSELDMAERRLSEEVRSASARIRTLRRLREERAAAVTARRDELAALEIAFQGGQRTLFELLETQISLTQARRSLNQARHALFLEYLTLAALTGRMGIDLEEIDGAQRQRIWGWEPHPDD